MLERITLPINEYFNGYPLENEYSFRFPNPQAWNNSPFPPEDYPDDLETDYDKTMYFKQYIIEGDWLTNDETFINSAFWIIQRWGRIHNFARSEVNIEKLWALKANVTVETPNLNHIPFSNISSISKVASLLNPDLCAIYDSRTIYSLNWLLFIYAPNLPLFHQPSGRNSAILNLNQQTVFDLTGEIVIYRNRPTCYAEYCNLLQFISSQLNELGRANTTITDIEMLLFTIASSGIIDDIRDRVTLIVNRHNL